VPKRSGQREEKNSGNGFMMITVDVVCSFLKKERLHRIRIYGEIAILKSIKGPQTLRTARFS